MTQPGEAGRAESGLRPAVRAAAGVTIVTGGQTGVDSYAAHAALRAGLPVHVIFPAGLRQEDGPLTPARRRRLAGAHLHELSDTGFEYRTWTAVYVSDAVLLLDPAGGAGCQETARAARLLGRPLLAPGPGQLTATQAADWLAWTSARVVLAAGCRASLLAGRRAGRVARTDIAEFIAGARQQHDALLARNS
jgi:Circularly permutated YpsA SLOG family